MNSWLGLPPGASSHAPAVDQLIGWSHVLVAAFLLVWGGVFALVVVRGLRRSAGPRSRGVGAKIPAGAELAVVIVEAILLIGLSIPLMGSRLALSPLPADVEVRVVAQQYVWNIHYPGDDGVFGRTRPELVDDITNPLGLDREDAAAADDVTTLNRLHLPVDARARIELTSRDMVHGFALPHFRVQRDAIPGLVGRLELTPTVTTAVMRQRLDNEAFDYEILCAQLCGLGHYRMRGFVEVHEAEGFEAWLAEQKPQALDDVDAFWQ